MLLANFLRERDQPPPGISPLDDLVDHLRNAGTPAKDHPDVIRFRSDENTSKTSSKHIVGAVEARVSGKTARVYRTGPHLDDAPVLDNGLDHIASLSTQTQYKRSLGGLANFLRERDRPPPGCSPLRTLLDRLRDTETSAENHDDINAFRDDTNTPKDDARNIAAAINAYITGTIGRSALPSLPLRLSRLHSDDVMAFDHYNNNATTKLSTRMRHIERMIPLANFLRERDRPPSGVSPITDLVIEMFDTETHANDHPDIQAYKDDENTSVDDTKHIGGAANAFATGTVSKLLPSSHPDDAPLFDCYRVGAIVNPFTRDRQIKCVERLAKFLRKRDQPPPGVSTITNLVVHLSIAGTRANDHPDIEAYKAHKRDKNTYKSDIWDIGRAVDAFAAFLRREDLGYPAGAGFDTPAPIPHGMAP